MKSICIFCEGKTEVNYIQSLNRLLEDEGVYDVQLTPKNLGGVNKNNYINKIKKYKAKDLKAFDEFYVWLDFDIFKRGGKTEAEIKDQISTININKKSVTLLLNFMNGEDFFILQCSDEKIGKWGRICNDNHHFNSPMDSTTYLPLIKTILPDYKKGKTIELSKEILQKCIKNSKKPEIPFRSDIVELLNMILSNVEL